MAFLLTTILSLGLSAYFVLLLVASASAGTLTTEATVLATLYLVVTIGSAAGGLALSVMNQTEQNLPRARLTARVTLVLLVVSLILVTMTRGLVLLSVIYLFQLACVVVFQLVTDPHLNRSSTNRSPWGSESQLSHKGYIPLNFFNIFWIFLVASVVGLFIEVIFRAITAGVYEDRAGLLWGPFSPIYGFGAVLMTVALNRFWDKSKVIIFVVAGAIGAAFEFATSYFMEKSFGIVAWDYSGTFLNIDGRTNFAFFCAWGLLGLAWIKLLLPDVLKIVDAVTLYLRTALTVAATLFMLANGVTTLVALDSWYEREVGHAPANVVQEYCATHFDNDYMAKRFQTMNLNPDRASRI
ncbi:MAG TPA: putative ABC transporter permease [Propionibacteriaceae bacterium]|nr:putative ABC transporter permease [Propionibacteriaceae bacterium]HPZ49107.1 putative ABC transporter permease [Propionibacteriaceae bacterium]HQE31641.1 putative ABC transporter permease [Propionibacteriaceae bacterium]